MAKIYEVGDILHYQFRYSASFPIFYKVNKVSAKSVVVQEIGKKMFENLDGYGQWGTEVPDVNVVRGRERRCKIGDDGRVLVNSQYRSWANLWDGKPKEYYGD